MFAKRKLLSYFILLDSRRCVSSCGKKKYEPHKPRLSNKPSNTPHPPKDPPEAGYNPEVLDHNAFKLPYFVRPASFRQFKSPTEVLGPDADKSKKYKNPEYFSYHRYSFVELQNHALRFRDERRAAAGQKVTYEGEDDEDEEEVFAVEMDKCKTDGPVNKPEKKQ